MTRKKGFSILELAIVLGIVGVVIGGIWATASNARRNVQASRLEQQTQVLVDNIRTYYASRALPAAQIVAATFTATLRTAGIFPEEMCPANCVNGTITTVYNGYGGTVTAAIPNLTAPINVVDLTYTGVDETGCIQLGSKLSARSGEFGLTSYTVDSALTTFPIPLSSLDSECDAANNTVVLRFTLRR